MRLGLESRENPRVTRTRSRTRRRWFTHLAQTCDQRREHRLDNAPGHFDGSAKGAEGARGRQLKLGLEGTTDAIQDLTAVGLTHVKQTLVTHRAMVTKDRRRDATGQSDRTWGPGGLGVEFALKRSAKACPRCLHGKVPRTSIILATTSGSFHTVRRQTHKLLIERRGGSAQSGVTDAQIVNEHLRRARRRTVQFVS